MDLSCRVPVCTGKGGHLCRLPALCPRIESYKSTLPSVPHFMRVPSASLLVNTYSAVFLFLSSGLPEGNVSR